MCQTRRYSIALTLVLSLLLVSEITPAAPEVEVKPEIRPTEFRVPTTVRPEANPLRGLYTTPGEGGRVRLDADAAARYLTFVEQENSAWSGEMDAIFGKNQNADVNARLRELRENAAKIRETLTDRSGEPAKLAKLDALLKERESTLSDLLEQAKKAKPGEILATGAGRWAVRSAVPREVADYLARSEAPGARPGGETGDHGNTAPARRVSENDLREDYGEVLASVIGDIRANLEKARRSGQFPERVGSNQFLERLEKQLKDLPPSKRPGALVLLSELKSLSELATCTECKAPMEVIIQAMAMAEADGLSRAEVYNMRNDKSAIKALARMVVFKNRLREALLRQPEFAKAKGSLEELQKDPALYQEFQKRLDDRYAEYLTMGPEGAEKLHESAISREAGKRVIFDEFVKAKEGEVGEKLKEYRGELDALLRALCDSDCAPWAVGAGTCQRKSRR